GSGAPEAPGEEEERVRRRPVRPSPVRLWHVRDINPPVLTPLAIIVEPSASPQIRFSPYLLLLCLLIVFRCVEFTLMLPEENHYKKKFASGKLGKDPTVVSSFLPNRREKSRSKRNENDYCGNSYIRRN
ncbi:unnamed protein product, partial [Musa textilis]